MNRHVIIVGAGVIGASIAFHLANRGMQVTVVDSEGPCAGASGACDGAVSVITKLPGPMMQLGWLGRSYYSELSQPDGPLQDVYHERSAFMVASTRAEVGIIDQQLKSLEQVGVSARVHEGNAIRTILPQLRSGIPVLLEVKNEGHALGYEVAHRLLQTSGARLITGLTVSSLIKNPDNGRCLGVRSHSEDILCDDVVVAAGLESEGLIPGVELLPQRGQLVVTDRVQPPFLKGHLFFAAYLAKKKNLQFDDEESETARSGAGLAIDPLQSGQLLIGSTRENDNCAQHTDFFSIQGILNQALDYLPEIENLEILRVFAGIRARSLDGLPIVGPVPDTPGLWVATGFASDGICLAPIIGRELSKLLMNEKTIAEVGLLSPSRFAELRAAS